MNIPTNAELEDRLDYNLRVYYRATNRGAKYRAMNEVRSIAQELANRAVTCQEDA